MDGLNRLTDVGADRLITQFDGRTGFQFDDFPSHQTSLLVNSGLMFDRGHPHIFWKLQRHNDILDWLVSITGQIYFERGLPIQ